MSEKGKKSTDTGDSAARLARLESDFQRTLEAEKLEAMAEFAAGAGHEINNPLTVISGRAQLLLREETDPERRHALALINAQAMRVYEMIADMMLFARPPRPAIQAVELVELIDGVAADFVQRGARQDTKVRRTECTGPIRIEADPVQLNVALRAICQNALEALGGGGNVTIGAAATDDEATVSISDDGPGMSLEERRHVFDPFYSARQAGRGLGLGLSKAWRIATNHGGRVDVESEPGRGTTVRFVIKRREAGDL